MACSTLWFSIWDLEGVFSCQHIRALGKAGMCFSVSFSYSLFYAEVNYVPMSNIPSVRTYLKMRAASFEGFQYMYFHALCILETFSTPVLWMQLLISTCCGNGSSSAQGALSGQVNKYICFLSKYRAPYERITQCRVHWHVSVRAAVW